MGALDFLTVGLIIFLIAILAIFGFIMATQFGTQLAGLGLPGLPNGWSATIQGFYTIMDGFTALGVGLLLVTMVIINFLTRSHPVFMILSFLMDIFIIPIGWLFSVLFDAFATNASITPYISNFPISVFVFQNFAVICFLIVLCSSVSLYIGNRQAPGSQSVGSL